MIALKIVVDYAASRCGGGEDTIGAFMYTGAARHLSGDVALVKLAQKINGFPGSKMPEKEKIFGQVVEYFNELAAGSMPAESMVREALFTLVSYCDHTKLDFEQLLKEAQEKFAPARSRSSPSYKKQP